MSALEDAKAQQRKHVEEAEQELRLANHRLASMQRAVTHAEHIQQKAQERVATAKHILGVLDRLEDE